MTLLPTVAQNAPYAWMIQGASSVGLPTIAQGAPYVWVIPADNSGNYAQTIVSVTSFGALPTNTAAQNDTAISTAIASFGSSPGVLLFPMIGNGVYQVSNAIIIDKDNISLVGLGNRLGAPTIQTNTDNAYQVVVGNTKNVNNVLIQGLNFQGLNSGTSTGGGINFRCIGGGILQCRVSNFGGTGINIIAFSGNIFEVLLDNVTLIQNGMNTVSAGDNLVIDGTVTDCEYRRVISLGNSAQNTTRYCINNSGQQQKFIACHCYFAKLDGFRQSAGQTLEIIGGEYETNANYGIHLSGGNQHYIDGVDCFGNSFADVFWDSATYGVLNGAVCKSNTGSRSILIATASTQIVIANSVIVINNGFGMDIQSGTGKVHVHDNIIESSTDAIHLTGTNCDIHDNLINLGNITETAGANSNNIHDNTIAQGGKTITAVGAATKVRNNPGFNPIGASNIVVGASPFTYTAGNTPEEVYITGGTVNPIVKNGITLFTATPATVHLEPGEAVVVTYTVIPTMNKDRH